MLRGQSLLTVPAFREKGYNFKKGYLTLAIHFSIKFASFFIKKCK